jgi:pimeloyl-ACP methyl ester carboxylesterase
MDGLAGIARVIAIELPGHGRTPGDGIRSIEDAAVLVRRTVEALGMHRVVIGGHSMGGAVAQQFALSSPEGTAGVVLVGTGARLRVMPKIFELIETDHPTAVRLITDLAVAPGASDAVRAAVHDETLRTSPRVLARDFAACHAFDVMTRLSQIRAPALVVCGAEDELTPPRYSEFLRSRIHGAELLIVPAAGHYVQLERPAEVTGAIARFLGALSGR